MMWQGGDITGDITVLYNMFSKIINEGHVQPRHE